MKKLTWPFLFAFSFLFSCQSKGFDGEVILEWKNNTPRNDDKTVIEQRLEKIGIKKYTIHIINDNTIKVEVKNVKDTLRFLQLMEYNEELGFWETYENPDVFPMLDDLDKRLSFKGDTIIKRDSLNPNYEEITQAETKLKHPLWYALQFSTYKGDDGRDYLKPGAEVGICMARDTAYINSLLKIGKQVCFPKDMILLWKLIPYNDSIFSLIALKKYPGTNGAFMNQTSVKNSKIEDGPADKKMLTLKFDEEGTELWEKMTRQNVGKCIGIILGDKVINYPRVESAITGGIASITGPDPEELKTIQQGLQMIPFKTKPTIINHHFEKKN